jgi:hypothetical protein
LGDFIRVDLDADGRVIFVKEAEGAMVPVLMERYGAAAAAPPAASRVRTVVGRREFGASSIHDNK